MEKQRNLDEKTVQNDEKNRSTGAAPVERMILFLERKSIKKNFIFATKTIDKLSLLPGND